jgi:hypothetical protein
VQGFRADFHPGHQYILYAPKPVETDGRCKALSASYYNACVVNWLSGRSDIDDQLAGLKTRAAKRRALVIPVAAALLASACGAPPPQPVPKEVVIWKNLGTWSGRGNTQTESFLGLTGALRMHWQTKNETPKGTGTFRLILQSAISGRALQEPVDEKGLGEGTAYVAEDPRVFYISIESANLDWSFTVEEALFGSQPENSKAP